MSTPPPRPHEAADTPPHVGAVPAGRGGGANPTVEEVFTWKRVKQFPWGGSIRTDGERKAWVGFGMHAEPVALAWQTDPERKCTSCNTVTPWRTQRGRPTHPNCGGQFDWMPREVIAQTVFDVAMALGATAVWKE